ncbi:MAG: bifunctional [glutamate--ammonia ligase]-adenylyl-L-tyrosine phosphorylase/[glutamate--ammonia-ligase] adenylyltransferase [Betaproteobacteria bacterium]
MDLAGAYEFSRYAQRLRVADPALCAAVEATLDLPFRWPEADIAALAHGSDPAALAVALRRLRQRVYLHVLLRDLTGRAQLNEVCAVMTRLAENVIATAVDAHSRWLAAIHGEPLGVDSAASEQLIVVAMGKLGGRELNVSSDVDLVFVYPEDGDTRGPKVLANQDFFDRLGRRVVAALAQPSAEGYVFRTDLRLRPYGAAGPLASSFSALEQYLVTQGRTWERYAWLKARAVTGARAGELEQLVAPFVYRKYLDYDAYDGLRDVHHQIREQGRRRDHAANVKLGPGGIREIEFITQALQLVRGGREPALRLRGTLPALAALRARGLLPAAAADELIDAYIFLRNVEHRLQYRDDAQTHDLPQDGGERAAVARAMGCADASAFDRLLDQHRNNVDRHFDALFAAADGGPERDPLAVVWIAPAPEDAQLGALAAAGYGDARPLIAELARVRQSPRYLQLPTASRARFDALVPRSLRAAATTLAPQTVFERLLALLETISRRSAYLALLVEHPPILPRLAQLLGASSWAADYLMQHPMLLDELLDSRALLAEPDWNAWRSELGAQLAAHSGDAERQMDALRHFQQAQVFRLLAQDLAGLLSVERLADHLSMLADIVLAAALAHCWILMQGSDTAAPHFAIIGYGKLGGKELGYASDLDLVFLYDDPDEAAAPAYARLAHRLTTWLTSTTAAGRLYDTDLRLRPDGASGLPVSSLAAFRNYQRHTAWTWEHQALTRARYVAGDARIGAAFEAERASILRLPRDPDKLGVDIVAMRGRMQAAHPNRSSLFDVKHDPGGMVDVEFAVQFLVLAHSSNHPAMTRNAGNIALLALGARLGLLPPDLASAVADAYREYRRLQHQVRLQGATEARVEALPQADRRAVVAALWQYVFGSARSEGEIG